MKRPICGAIVVVMFLMLRAPGYSAERVYSNLNCALTVPQSWKNIAVEKTNLALLKSPDGLRSVVLDVRTVDPTMGVDVGDGFKSGLKRAFEKGGVIRRDASLTMCGYPAYEIDGYVPFDGRQVSTLVRFVMSPDRVYKVNCMFIGGDAAGDQTLQEALRSFRVLEPSSAGRGSSGAVYEGKKVLGVVVFFLLVVLFGAWVIQRQRRAYVQQRGQADT